jgi:hypothetical protein
MSDYTQPYTPEGKHPEDAIYEVKTFVNKLQDVQEDYVQRLSKGLKLTQEGEEYLFDYIYNIDNKNREIDDFAHYLEILGRNYDTLIQK